MHHTIELRNVSKYYTHDESVSMGLMRTDLDLDLGEFVVITGESGSGKSTLLNVISGLDTYEEGEMFVCGEDTTAYGTEEYENYRKTYIGNIFQNFNLINSYTVYENIEIVMLLAGRDKKQCKERVNQLIGLAGLSEFTNTKASRLSGGQKQRVAIARAIAKDAPIIVADEPTGNLDSESAAAVMETLAKAAEDKLVVIVTHNYEQAEPYATRKLTMHDGKIIEDRKTGRAERTGKLSIDQMYEYLAEEAGRQKQGDAENLPEMPAPGQMKKSDELRIGVRNTFNLAAKFLLLFAVYFFVSSAVLGQYATEKNSMHESSLLGSNPHFLNTSADRIVVKKANEAVFTDKDYEAIKTMPNVKGIVKNDIALDKGVSVSLGDIAIEGPMASFDQIPEGELTYGRRPLNDREIVIRLDATNDAFMTMANGGAEYIGETVVLGDINQKHVYDISEGITISGIIIDSMDTERDKDYSIYGYPTIYASEAVSAEIMASMMASVSKTELNFGGTRLSIDYGRAVYVSPNVPDGKVFLLEDETTYYPEEENGEDDESADESADESEDKDEEKTDTEDDDKIEGKPFGIKVENRFFSSAGSYTVDRIITRSNCSKLIGLSADDFDDIYNCVFISPADFGRLFSRGSYQISVFMIDEQESDDTQQALNDSGYTTLVIKDSLTDSAGDLGKVLDLATYGRLALEFVVLFFIAYAVIRLIMRSRNPYYSTLRMLGATGSNIRNIIRTELILMMLIAYGVVVLISVLINTGALQELTGSRMAELTKLLCYLKPLDYSILGVLLLMMSLLIANRYSRHIFKMSAMKTFREEV